MKQTIVTEFTNEDIIHVDLVEDKLLDGGFVAAFNEKEDICGYVQFINNKELLFVNPDDVYDFTSLKALIKTYPEFTFKYIT